MNNALLLFVGGVYGLVGINYFISGKIGLGLIFICYGLANVGFTLI